MTKPPHGAAHVIKSGVSHKYFCNKHQMYLIQEVVYQVRSGQSYVVCVKCLAEEGVEIQTLRPRLTPAYPGGQRIFRCESCMYSCTGERELEEHNLNCVFNSDNAATCFADDNDGTCDENAISECRVCGKDFCKNHLAWPSQLCLGCVYPRGSA
jgi:hypothetical protein